MILLPISTFCCENWGTRLGNNLSKVTQIVSGRVRRRLEALWNPQSTVINKWPRITFVTSPSRYCGLKTGLLTSSMVGFMVTNQCTFHSPIGFPQIPVAALAVEKMGRSSVHYRLALFPPKSTPTPPAMDYQDLTNGFFSGHPKLAQFDTSACTTGSAVHVFVSPATSKPMGLPDDFRRGLLRLMSPTSL